MIQGVSFNGMHCQDNLGMLLASKTIGQPTVQTHFIDVPGRNGQLDLTEALTGDVRYGSRPITLRFVSCKTISQKDWPDFISNVANAIHGQRVQIKFDEDPDHYWVGRCEMSSVSISKGKISFTIDCTCDPFKYDDNANESL